MKKSVLILFLFLIVIASAFIIVAEDEECDENCKEDKGIECLSAEIGDECNENIETKIFSILAINKCGDEFIADAKINSEDELECWPEKSCKVKTTAQAILALEKLNKETDPAEAWIISKSMTETSLQWFLQIDAEGDYSCTINYGDKEAKVKVNEDKTLEILSDSGTCLSESDPNYWLKIDNKCYEKEFLISCDKAFVTNLWYKKAGSKTKYVSSETNPDVANGETREKIESKCFGSNDCDYEDTLWAALILRYKGNSVESYLPYLMTYSDDDDYSEYLPQAFLMNIIADDFLEQKLLDMQFPDGFWRNSLNKYYDTALVYYLFGPMGMDDSDELKLAKEWLLEEQQTSGKTAGCWNNGNKRDTALILYALFGEGSSDYNGEGGSECSTDSDCETGESCVNGYCMSGSTISDCETSGNYCLAASDCTAAGGHQFPDKKCLKGLEICCSSSKKEDVCSEMPTATICNSNQDCTTSEIDDAIDLSAGQVCCLGGGQCIAKQTDNICSSNSGMCMPTGCEEGYEEADYACPSSTDSCCLESDEKNSGYWWIWVLLGLIILIILAILFRDKLRPYWLRMQSKFKKSPSNVESSNSRLPSGRPRRPLPRRMSSTPQKFVPPKTSQKNPKNDLDDVLKKLKDMGQ